MQILNSFMRPPIGSDVSEYYFELSLFRLVNDSRQPLAQNNYAIIIPKKFFRFFRNCQFSQLTDNHLFGAKLIDLNILKHAVTLI